MLRHGIPMVLILGVILILAVPWYVLFEHVIPGWPAELRGLMSGAAGFFSMYLLIGLMSGAGCLLIACCRRRRGELEAPAGSTGVSGRESPGTRIHDHVRSLDPRFLMQDPQTARNMRWLQDRLH